MTDVLKSTGHLLCRMFLDIWICLVASHVQVQVTHFWQKCPRSDLVLFQYVVSGGSWYQIVLFLAMSASITWCLPGFSTIKVLFYHLCVLKFLWEIPWDHSDTDTLPHSLSALAAIADSCRMVMVQFHHSFCIHWLALYCVEQLSLLPHLSVYITLGSWILT